MKLNAGFRWPRIPQGFCPETLLTLTFLLLSVQAGATSSQLWHYTLLPDSTLLDDCPICDRVSRPLPMRGGFDLRLINENPLFANYVLENIAFTAGFSGERTYQVSGRGSYRVGGEVALIQDLCLELNIDDGITNRFCLLTNATPRVERLWPLLQASLIQTNGTITQVYNLQFLAAPFREIWFSTATGMTPGIWHAPTNHLSGGDLLSSTGRLVKRNQDLTARLGIMPVVPDLGLDALDVLAGGEIAFSIEQSVFSESLGPLQAGDLLSSSGRLRQRNQQLTAAFGTLPTAPDAGLDAIEVREGGEVYFSVKKAFFSEVLGRTIGPGDLLSNRGRIVKRNEELVARFQPVNPKSDFGLDAFHVWGSGEIWFSVETAFQGRNQEHYGAGDLLSDQGYVVSRNLQLVNPFQPLEDLADFGLDSVFVVSDTTVVGGAPRFTGIHRSSEGSGVELNWEGQGRVWQVLRGPSLLGPWAPVSPIIPDLYYTDRLAPSSQAYYQVVQW